MSVCQVQLRGALVIIHPVSESTLMLICKFASHRSRPEKIQGWISYLEELSEKHESDSEARRTLDHLLDEARGWTEPISFAR